MVIVRSFSIAMVLANLGMLRDVFGVRVVPTPSPQETSSQPGAHNFTVGQRSAREIKMVPHQTSELPHVSAARTVEDYHQHVRDQLFPVVESTTSSSTTSGKMEDDHGRIMDGQEAASKKLSSADDTDINENKNHAKFMQLIQDMQDADEEAEYDYLGGGWDSNAHPGVLETSTGFLV